MRPKRTPRKLRKYVHPRKTSLEPPQKTSPSPRFVRVTSEVKRTSRPLVPTAPVKVTLLGSLVVDKEEVPTKPGYPDDVCKEHATIILCMFSFRTNHSGSEDPPSSALNMVGGHSPHCDVWTCCSICHCHNSLLSDTDGYYTHTKDGDIARNFGR